MTKPILEVEDLRGYYRGVFGVVHAIDGVSFSLDHGKIMGIAGESGGGKSTLAQLVSGSPPPLLHHEGGKILVDGIDIYNIDPEELRTEVKCKRMSYVPQASMESLNPVKRIRDFIFDVVAQRTNKRVRTKERKEEVLEMATNHMKTLGLEPKVLDLYPHELSGGMKQRVVIAISTLWNPKLLIIDEPTSALDVTSQKRMIKALLNLKEIGIIESMLYISHDLTSLRQLCDECMVMYGGKITEIGDMDGIIDEPKHPYSSLLTSAIASYDSKGKCSHELKSIPGSPPDLREPPTGCRFHPRCPYVMDVCRTEEPPMVKTGEGKRRAACWLLTSKTG
ncbi:ABC transporter ATP-binding protein [Candidatus Thorarchaeota archaeon]|nr:MAG: ABC transporter ATP-binding protein [Candidatus Thorarchaeota archaeon]